MDSDLRLRNFLTIAFIVTGTASLFSTITLIKPRRCRTFSMLMKQDTTRNSFIPTCKYSLFKSDTLHVHR